MDLFFLGSPKGIKITKTYTINNGKLEKQPFPNIYEFDSFKEVVSSIDDMETAIIKHAALGNTLLKGKLATQLVAQSRKGSTDANEFTEFMVIDADKMQKISTPEEFIMQCLPVAFHAVDYVFQYSCSGLMEPSKGFSGHFYFLLSSPQYPAQLKLYLKHCNLTSDKAGDSITLSKNGMTLKWPIDITVCQNDKLIYIAHPTCTNGAKPKTTNAAIAKVIKTNRTVDIDYQNITDLWVNEHTQQKADELRKKLGIKRATPKYKNSSGTQILTNPTRCALTAPPKYERGFVYLSLNGGKSYPYWHPEDNPNIIYNFKGEPAVFTRDFLPGYWRQLTKAVSTNKSNTHHMVFRDITTDTYWNGTINSTEESYELHKAASKEKLHDYLLNNGIDPPETIPDWQFIFKPMSNVFINEKEKTINKFIKSKYLKLKPDKAMAIMPPFIMRVITHVLGDDQKCVDHFLNWLAVIFQTRKKTGTAWLLQGTTATGKGIVFNSIIKPLLGPKYCPAIRLADLDDKFNAFLEHSCVVFIDEMQIKDSQSNVKLMNYLKKIITEPTIQIRSMRQDYIEVDSLTNLIFAANTISALMVELNDRRINVPPYQKKQLFMNEYERTNFDIIIKSELEYFAQFLMAYDIDINKASIPIETDAKRRIQKLNQTSLDTFFTAIQDGDLDFFAQNLLPTVTVSTPNTYFDFESIVRDWITSVNSMTGISRNDIRLVYEHLISGKAVTPGKFKQILAHHGLHDTKRIRVDAIRIRGYEITWKATAQDVEEWNEQKINAALHAAPTL